MMRIELLTSDKQHVAWVEIPAFKSFPDVVGWGDRVFKFWSTIGDDGGPPQYVECFAVVSVTPSPGLPELG